MNNEESATPKTCADGISSLSVTEFVYRELNPGKTMILGPDELDVDAVGAHLDSGTCEVCNSWKRSALRVYSEECK